ncbi:MAG: nodulation protein NfeD [Chlorobium sp.]|nr:nodulation protein NfeD [Chlorobium sp.]MCF8216894.1 nodulation protein NfeD [Chlorobium sp.]MCF8271740.1 nodulation protein NfeD [Chlorobium sp.]MCF8288128.1 nodulation protein NfeD [Chlorobium sp.]MCF8291719.1 nodulation protein NfeD [Chlorobium sp.]MCF8385794.1 nodulation protein NfeD [Chlorobium sp.]
MIMHVSDTFYRRLFCSALLFQFFFFSVATADAAGKRVSSIALKGSVNPASAQYFSRALDKARTDGSHAFLVELDTPGGLVSSLREMVQDVMASEIPVIVYVSPSGSQAASAGALLMLSAHVAAMSPGTEIGAAHPVGMGGGDKEGDVMSKKAASDLAAFARSLAEERGRNARWAEDAVRESRASSAQEALAAGVIEVVADDTKALFRAIDGKLVKTAGGEVRLQTSRAIIEKIEPAFQEKALMMLADPNLAYIFFLAGLAGIYFELSNPGAIFPGVAGAISLILGLYAMQMLPVNITGIILLVLAAIFIGLELFVTSGGIFAIAGLIALFAGSLMLFSTPGTGIELSLLVFLPVFLVFVSAVAGIIWVVARSAVRRQVSGIEGMIGETGTVFRDITPPFTGKVFFHGELWDAVADTPIPSGTDVLVKEVDGLQVHVTIKQD